MTHSTLILFVGIAFRDVLQNVHPTIGLQTPGEIVDVNFGQSPFVFDISDIKKEIIARTFRTILDFPPSHNNTELKTSLQRIVMGYLAHQVVNINYSL